MPKIAYVNGRYDRLADASVHIEDRGYQFADGVYEVCLVIGGALWDADGHMARLHRSLAALEIDPPMSDAALRIVMREVMKRNRLTDALIYMQVTRGVAPRNHSFPSPPVAPALVVTAKRYDRTKIDRLAEKGVAVVIEPDIRWGRCDIKSVSLLPNILARQRATRAKAGEAWLVRDGVITEGSSSNAWIVTKAGEIVTHPLSPAILGGVTRETVLRCAEELQMKIVERPFTPQEAADAAEAFLTSATNMVMPVVSIDGRAVGGGAPGPVAKRLRAAYIARCASA